MKRWPYLVIGLIVLFIIGGLVWQDRDRLGLSKLFGAIPHHESASSGSAADESGPARISWRTAKRTDDGFEVDLPTGSTDAEAPAFNESGGTEPVKMLRSSPDGDTVYAVTWEDNPPVARTNGEDPDRTLNQARDGMLANTQATLVSENRITVANSPGREILAHNAAGGILDVRLIFVPNGENSRLYTLMALFPTAGTRSDTDVTRFFGSFRLTPPASNS